MERSEDHPQVAWLSVTLAALIPLAVAALVAVLLAQAGPHEVVLAGVPRDQLRWLDEAAESEASVFRYEAVTKATEIAALSSHTRVRQVALGRYSEEASDYDRGHLVWVVSFVPNDLAPFVPNGPFGRDGSCDWAYHYQFLVVAVDAERGEVHWSSQAAFFDPSLPPTYDAPNNSDREYCERLQRGRQAAARESP